MSSHIGPTTSGPKKQNSSYRGPTTSSLPTNEMINAQKSETPHILASLLATLPAN